MIVSDVAMVESEPYSKISRTHCLKICKMGRAWSPFLLTVSYTMVPAVAALQDFLKVLFEGKFRVESNT